MKYSYSKPAPSPEYRAQTPSRVSPVGASSFHGGKGGGGIFPFLPFSSSETPYDEPAEMAADGALEAQAENALEASGENAIFQSQLLQDEIAKQRQSKEHYEVYIPSEQTTIRGASGQKVQAGSGSGIRDNLAKSKETTEQPTSTKKTTHSEVYVPSAQTTTGASGQKVQRESGSGQKTNLNASYGGSGADVLMEPEESLYRSFEDVQLPEESVSFKVGKDEVQEPYIKEDSIPASKPLKTTGQMSFGNVQNLPVPDTTQFQQDAQVRKQSFFGQAAEFGNNFLQYATQYQADKMENPLREIGIQTGASILAAPVLGAVGVSAVPAAAATAVSQAAQKIIPQTSAPAAPSTPSNIVNFADVAKKVATAAATAGAVSQALPAAAQTSGWNAGSQTYTSPSGQNTNTGTMPKTTSTTNNSSNVIRGRI